MGAFCASKIIASETTIDLISTMDEMEDGLSSLGEMTPPRARPLTPRAPRNSPPRRGYDDELTELMF